MIIRIAVMTTDNGCMDVVYTYDVDTNYGTYKIMLYDNLIPLNVHGILTDTLLVDTPSVPTIVDKDIQINNHAQDILRLITQREDLIIT